MNLLDAALAYAESGWRVLPVNGRKVPLTDHGVDDATTDPRTVETWWTLHPDAGIAVRIPEGCVIIDLDVARGGPDAFEALFGDPPITVTTLTGGGGRHLWFRGDAPTTKDGIGSGIEVRSGNAYVIVPPTLHESGRRYEWMTDQSPDDMEMAPLPEAIAQAARGFTSGPAPKVEGAIPEGTRDNTLASLAGSMRRRGMSETAILAALQEENATRCRPPLPERDIERIARSISRYEPAERIGTPVYNGPPTALTETLEVFRKWLHLPDEIPALAVLGTVAANRLDGDPVWLGLVAPPSSAKTEILNALSLLPDVHHAGTLTPAGLLSGTGKKEYAADAKGGLLRKVGEFGILVMKDFGSVLSLRSEAKAEVLAGLREIYDGQWTRVVGTEGGRSLTWQGKLGLLFGATPALDSHHTVIGAMGERFVLVRIEAGGPEQARQALRHKRAQVAAMRQELAEAVAGLFAGELREPREMNGDELEHVIDLAYTAVRMRSTVERDRYSREVESIHGAEGPARLALALEQLAAGLSAIGTDTQTALKVVRRIALDSVPPLRRDALKLLQDRGMTMETPAIATALGLPTKTAGRALEDLAAYGLVVREKQGAGKADLWSATE